MPPLTKITGNQREVVGRAYNNKKQFSKDIVARKPFAQATSVLLGDIQGHPFYRNNINENKQYKQFVLNWLENSDTSYNQGNTTASIYDFLLQNYVHELNDEEKENILMGRFGKVNFSFYDDDGKLCGLSIHYSKKDPSLWTIAIIRNTNAAPEQREALLIASTTLLKTNAKGTIEGNDASKAILDFLHANKLKDLFIKNQVISPSGKLNLEHVTTFKENIASDSESAKQSHEILFAKPIYERHLQTRNNVVLDFQNTVPDSRNLDKASERSFMGRNWKNIGLGLIAVISVVLIFTGVLAPLGIATGVTAFLIAGIGSGAVAGGAFGKVGWDELKLHRYHKKMAEIDNKFESDYRADVNKYIQEKRPLFEIDAIEQQQAHKNNSYGDVLIPGLYYGPSPESLDESSASSPAKSPDSRYLLTEAVRDDSLERFDGSLSENHADESPQSEDTPSHTL